MRGYSFVETEFLMPRDNSASGRFVRARCTHIVESLSPQPPLGTKKTQIPNTSGMHQRCEMRPLRRTFIGQGKGAKGGVGGITQKEQQKVLSDFRLGKFNTLVATCIGEEGLDICQVRAHLMTAPEPHR